MFKKIETIEDVAPFVAHKKEIRLGKMSNGCTSLVYMFTDSHTFDTLEALECRGIIFDKNNKVCSRPLHKFFNVGEKEHLSLDKLLVRTDVVGVFEKLDGSMIATANVEGVLDWRTKKSFSSDVALLAKKMLLLPENKHIVDFANEVIKQNLTAIFEITHPEARIVVKHVEPLLTLLHVRDNTTGEYVLLDKNHSIHGLIEKFNIKKVKLFDNLDLKNAFESLESMVDMEGYVIQFENGDMAKIKCPWYLRFHRAITFLRERDIALSALKEELDDLKNVLAEAGVDLTAVLEIEEKLKNMLVDISTEIETTVNNGRHLSQKDFAISHKNHPLFGLLMMEYQGKEYDLKDWFIKNKLKTHFSLRVLVDGALADAISG